jgi:transcriptional regulator with XRE-family HTH domain
MKGMTSIKCQRGIKMFKNKNQDGTLNLCGDTISRFRKERKLSQRALADELQRKGLDLGKNAIQQIESKERFVTDIELRVIASYFRVTIDELVD